MRSSTAADIRSSRQEMLSIHEGGSENTFRPIQSMGYPRAAYGRREPFASRSQRTLPRPESLDIRLVSPTVLSGSFSTVILSSFASSKSFSGPQKRDSRDSLQPLHKRTSTLGRCLPPLAEQHRIIAELDRRLSAVDQLDAAVDFDMRRGVRLRQAILKRAFEGKLVRQDPNDEPAAVLLKRIRASRAVSASKRAGPSAQKRNTKITAESAS